MPLRNISTIIVDPHMLVREGLTSLIANYSYRVVGSYNSAEDIQETAFANEGEKLVILGAQAVDRAITEADRIRKLWPDGKIVLLLERISAEDFQKLFSSTIDGCIPLYVSQEVLARTLDLVMADDARIMVVTEVPRSSVQADTGTDSAAFVDKDQTDAGDEPRYPDPSIVPFRHHHDGNSNGVTSALSYNGHIHTGDPPDDALRQARPRSRPKLSEREIQILDGLVKGHANKLIARECAITEATVKVHMKSILRKIQVTNRTQAAIWAIEHGYTAADLNDRLLKATEHV